MRHRKIEILIIALMICLFFAAYCQSRPVDAPARLVTEPMTVSQMFDLLNTRLVDRAEIDVHEKFMRTDGGEAREVYVGVILDGKFYPIRGASCDDVMAQIRDQLGGYFVAMEQIQ